MLRGIRREREATKESHQPEGNETDAESQTDPLQNVGHLHPFQFPRDWSRQRGDWFIVETLTLACIPDESKGRPYAVNTGSDGRSPASFRRWVTRTSARLLLPSTPVRRNSQRVARVTRPAVSGDTALYPGTPNSPADSLPGIFPRQTVSISARVSSRR